MSELLTPEQEEILKNVKDIVAKEVSKMTFKFNEKEDEYDKLRCPNLKEQKEWLMRILRYEHELGNISVEPYRTIKGEIRKGHFDIVFNFLRKRRYPDIVENFNKYKGLKCMYERKLDITFPGTTTIYSIDITVNKENINK